MIYFSVELCLLAFTTSEDLIKPSVELRLDCCVSIVLRMVLLLF